MQRFDKKTKDKYLGELKEKHNLWKRQIGWLTGINKGVILKV